MALRKTEAMKMKLRTGDIMWNFKQILIAAAIREFVQGILWTLLLCLALLGLGALVGCGGDPNAEAIRFNACDAQLTECVKAIGPQCEATPGCVRLFEVSCLDQRDACLAAE